MKCRNHPAKDAIGSCTICGVSLCEDCAVKVDRSIYCESDVDSVFRPTPM
ncbi:MAG: hypothetical protein NZ920_05345 [Aigarchaeota archaeon]|nr:hypothetical protein [Aigarchaeota archaeon]MDW8092879.1 B-box zinc finger protein [Nitrososphaerota archaeon]